MSLPRPRATERRSWLRHGPVFDDASIVLMPALRRLSAAGEDSVTVNEAIEAIPPHLLVLLIEHGLRRRVLKWGTMSKLILAAGPERLAERFGRDAAVIARKYQS